MTHTGTLHPSRRSSEIEFSPFILMQEYVEQHPHQDLIHLNQGAPNLTPPPHVISAAARAIQENKTNTYTHTLGIPALREAISQKLLNRNKITASPEQIIVTSGATEGVLLALLLTADPGEEIFLMTPSYAAHIDQVQLAGLRPAFLQIDSQDGKWQFNPAKLEKEIQRRLQRGLPLPRSMILCTPHNPTGLVISRDTLIELSAIAGHYGIWLITDETYEDFTFNGHQHFSPASEPEVASACISCFTLSKSYGMTGWRVGYTIIPDSLASRAKPIHDMIEICAASASQYAALAAITGPQDSLTSYREQLAKQRKQAIQSIQNLSSLRPVLGHGAFYLFPEIRTSEDSVTFCRKLAEETGVIILPGEGFGPGGEKHVRISTISSPENIDTAFQRIMKWERTLHAQTEGQ